MRWSKIEDNKIDGDYMDITEMQNFIEEFCKRNNLNHSVEIRILDLVSEIGELAKEILLASNYGERKVKSNEKVKLEIGDALFSLVTVANDLDINMEKALKDVMKKYEKRIAKHQNPGSC